MSLLTFLPRLSHRVIFYYITRRLRIKCVSDFRRNQREVFMQSEGNRGFRATGMACGFLALAVSLAPQAGFSQQIGESGATEIHFDFDSDRLRPDAQSALQQAAGALSADAARSVRVIGHADAPGSNAYNRNLGERRAKAAAGALIGAGVAAERISVYTRGESDPVVYTNGRSEANRRVSVLPAACVAWRGVALTEEDEAASPAALLSRADEAAALYAELAASGSRVGGYLMSAAAVESCGVAAGYESGEPRRLEYAQRCLCDSDRMRIAARD
ncbi:MAG: OmpA family protein [Pikeienuella sp.]